MYKQKDTENMYYNWKRAFVDCPGHDKKIYIVGAKIFQNKIKEARHYFNYKAYLLILYLSKPMCYFCFQNY